MKQSTKIYFSHGKLSSPDSKKIGLLDKIANQLGFVTKIIDYTHTFNPDERVQHLIDTYHHDDYKGDYLLVGSSMGGYASVVASGTIHPKGIFLLAPALYMENYAIQDYPKPEKTYVEIVHGWQDEIVNVDKALTYAKAIQCTIHIIDDDHQLANSHESLAQFFTQFLNSFK